MKLVINSAQKRAEAVELVRNITGSPLMSVEVKEHKETRSQAQNRLMWMWYGLLSKHISEHYGKEYPPTIIHESCKEMWQPAITWTDLHGVQRNRVKSTTENNTKEQAEFLEKLLQYAAVPWQCILPLPDDLRFAMLTEKEKKVIGTFDGEIVEE
jgi:hypothetical protein